jgi:hypothetical protein
MMMMVIKMKIKIKINNPLLTNKIQKVNKVLIQTPSNKNYLIRDVKTLRSNGTLTTIISKNRKNKHNLIIRKEVKAVEHLVKKQGKPKSKY